jgi:PIN domain nuclease of toxin-antitoxin system
VLPRSLSLGDRACLALGLSTGAMVLTADSQWKAVGLKGVAIVTIH